MASQPKSTFQVIQVLHPAFGVAETGVRRCDHVPGPGEGKVEAADPHDRQPDRHHQVRIQTETFYTPRYCPPAFTIVPWVPAASSRPFSCAPLTPKV